MNTMPDHIAEMRFRVTSFDPRFSSGELASNLADSMSGLAAELRSKYNVQVEAEREQSAPIDPVTAYLVIKFVGAAVAGGFLKKLGEDAYTYLKGVIKNGSVEAAE